MEEKDLSIFELLESGSVGRLMEIVRQSPEEVSLMKHPSTGEILLHLVSSSKIDLSQKVNLADFLLSFSNVTKQLDSRARGSSPLHYACLFREKEIASLLLKAAIKSNILEKVVRAENEQSQQPLHLACKSGNIQIVQQLLETNFCDINAQQDCFSSDPLTRIQQQSKEIEALRPSQKSFLLQSLEFNISKTPTVETNYEKSAYGKKKSGWSALHFACKNKSDKLIKLLLKQKGCSLKIDALTRSNPIHFFMSNHNPDSKEEDIEEICELLVEISEKEILEKDVDGETPLHLSIMKASDSEILHVAFSKFKKLLDKFSRKMEEKELINLRNGNEQPLITLACQYSVLPFVRELLRKDADLNYVDNFGSCCIHEVCQLGQVDLLVLILSLGNPNVNQSLQRFPKSFPLHLAATHEKEDTALEMVDLLVQNGAEIDARDVENKKAEEVTQHLLVKEYLLDLISVEFTMRKRVFVSRSAFSKEAPQKVFQHCGNLNSTYWKIGNEKFKDMERLEEVILDQSIRKVEASIEFDFQKTLLVRREDEEVHRMVRIYDNQLGHLRSQIAIKFSLKEENSSSLKIFRSLEGKIVQIVDNEDVFFLQDLSNLFFQLK